MLRLEGFKFGKVELAKTLSCMLAIVPIVGFPGEELLQDTLKSILVALFALCTAIAFLFPLRKQVAHWHWHGLLLFPLILMTYALASMSWSHTYLGGAEAVRWAILGLLMWMGLQCFTRKNATFLVWSIHLGAVGASLWAASQFWFDLQWIAQGPGPASTFVNRNFFAEYLVCTLPFSVLLLTLVRDKATVFFLVFSLTFNIVAAMMTGTRSALLAMLLLGIACPIVLCLARRQVESKSWRHWQLGLALGIFGLSIFTLGSIPNNNRALAGESGHISALERAFARSLSMTQVEEFSRGSFSIRSRMWKATGKMIAAHPIGGVGAGAWEVQIPLYQETGTQMETDFYAHNEFLQLLAEYGLVGWLFLCVLFFYLAWATYNTWKCRTGPGDGEFRLRALTLASIGALLVVSNAGFPWRMATTGAMLVLSLSVLGASDQRLGISKYRAWGRVTTSPRRNWFALGITGISLIFCIYISYQAIACESKLVRAIKIALTISASGNPQDESWQPAKASMLELAREGIAINPHYRKLTPTIADALAQWGDWKNATLIWESLVPSRPYIVVLLANVARGHLRGGNLEKAQQYFDRARAIQPSAPSLQSLELMIWSETGKTKQAMEKAKVLLSEGTFDQDTIQLAYRLGLQQGVPDLAILALKSGIQAWPHREVDGWIKLGDVYASPSVNNEDEALHAYQMALEATTEPYLKAVMSRIPGKFLTQLMD